MSTVKKQLPIRVGDVTKDNFNQVRPKAARRSENAANRLRATRARGLLGG